MKKLMQKMLHLSLEKKLIAALVLENATGFQLVGRSVMRCMEEQPVS
ncbi:hypothetical protein [Paenibacillus sp. FSL W7-1332]